MAENPRKQTKFPKADYDNVIQAYEYYKGVKFEGEEYKPIQQTIKTMFLSQRTAEQIIAFMKWLAESDEGWTKLWTIRTVKMKLPEFVAGKLGTQEKSKKDTSFQDKYGKYLDE